MTQSDYSGLMSRDNTLSLSLSWCGSCQSLHAAPHSGPIWDILSEVEIKGMKRQCGEEHSVSWLQEVLSVRKRQRAPLGMVGLWLTECKRHTSTLCVYSICHRWRIWYRWETKSVEWPSSKLPCCHYKDQITQQYTFIPGHPNYLQ